MVVHHLAIQQPDRGRVVYAHRQVLPSDNERSEVSCMLTGREAEDKRKHRPPRLASPSSAPCATSPAWVRSATPRRSPGVTSCATLAEYEHDPLKAELL